MDGRVRLTERQRTVLLTLYRSADSSVVSRRAHILLLLNQGRSWAFITSVLFCSSKTIAATQRRFKEQGLKGVRQDRRSGRSRHSAGIIATLVVWVAQHTPRDFGFHRSRWCCEALVIVAEVVLHTTLSRETIRRGLHRAGLVWRRPRPIVGKRDPERARKLRELRALLAALPPDEVAVFMDEVDINTNPKIGCMWMYKGRQATVVTPGDNEKTYIAGTLNWRSGDVIWTAAWPKEGRSTRLFLRHLDDLRHHLRCYHRIHVICDNASAHRGKRVEATLAEWGNRIVIHYLPTRAPEANLIERLWWQLHEEITRNHTCQGLPELLKLALDWLEDKKPFPIDRGFYSLAA